MKVGQQRAERSAGSFDPLPLQSWHPAMCKDSGKYQWPKTLRLSLGGAAYGVWCAASGWAAVTVSVPPAVPPHLIGVGSASAKSSQ